MEKIDVLDHGFVRLDRNGRDISKRLLPYVELAARLKPLFLVHLESLGEIRAAARSLPASVNTIQGWIKRDPEFCQRVKSILAAWRGVDGVRKCRTCAKVKPTKEFSDRTDRPNQRTTCKECKRKICRESYHRNHKTSFFKHKANRVKSRASSLGVPCDVGASYLESLWTGICPVFGTSLDRDTPRTEENAPELDRIVPALGYVKGNVVWLSRRANRLKNNISVAELKLLLFWLEKTIIVETICAE